MSTLYKNPPILETVCEFRFVLKNAVLTEVDVSRFYSLIQEFFPIKEKSKLNQIEFKFDSSKTPEENKDSVNHGFYEFDQFFSEDRKYFVQLDNARMSIHRIKPYISWENFNPLIQIAYSSFVEIFKPEMVSRIGLRYINEFVFSKENFIFSDCFSLSMTVPTLTLEDRKSFFFGSVFGYRENKDAIKIQFSDKPLSDNSEEIAFVLDLDYFSVESSMSLKDAFKWAEAAHTNVEGVFEAMLTDSCREILNK